MRPRPSHYDAPTSRIGSITLGRRLALDGLSVAGWVFAVFAYLLITGGQLVAGVDLEAYIRAGQDLLAGRPVYTGEIGQRLVFSYAPPWAVGFALLAWVPGWAMQLAVIVLDLLSIRYLTGSWLRSGLVLLFPLTPFVIAAGNIELMIAAAIVLAWRSGRVEPLVVFALAKIAPALAIPPRRWRAAALAVGVAFLITLPWWWLWPEWFQHLLRQPVVIAISIPIPWYFRLPVALALLLLRRPWAAALAVVVAMPSLYLSTLLILLAPLRLFLDERAGRFAPRKADEPALAAEPARPAADPAVRG